MSTPNPTPSHRPPLSTAWAHATGARWFAAVALALAAASDAAAPAKLPELPQRLSDTGLYAAGAVPHTAPDVLPFSPQYPLWTDGAAKRRWLRLPRGASIDASKPDAWVFPVGTRLWKEFAFDGRPVETRMIERLADGRWRFATYVWKDDGSDAMLAPAAGFRALPVARAPGGRYAVPSRNDCLACHESTEVPVLGASALQLSPDRDPLGAAPAGVDLVELLRRGLLRGLPQALLDTPPRIAGATPTERAALGVLHGNCGHCHNDSTAAAPLRLTLAQSAAQPEASRQRLLQTTLGVASRFATPALPADAPRIAPGHPQASVLAWRMRSRWPATQMPPLGTTVPDTEGLALIERWIANDLPANLETRP